jgi:hypothetical protein
LYFRALNSTILYLLGDKTKEQSDLGKREDGTEWVEFVPGLAFLFFSNRDIYSNEVNSENSVTVWSA